ncbi:unnamed protein product [Prorocentrum cordatum]|uniref:Uncharacterized protein n=1 Tax=Prorocentrum cordatum TaxID=2364126 RepID=A0ABN9T330_9DINO|nr:unnamed protein product [Polarella glacialis]
MPPVLGRDAFFFHGDAELLKLEFVATKDARSAAQLQIWLCQLQLRMAVPEAAPAPGRPGAAAGGLEDAALLRGLTAAGPAEDGACAQVAAALERVLKELESGEPDEQALRREADVLLGRVLLRRGLTRLARSKTLRAVCHIYQEEAAVASALELLGAEEPADTAAEREAVEFLMQAAACFRGARDERLGGVAHACLAAVYCCHRGARAQRLALAHCERALRQRAAPVCNYPRPSFWHLWQDCPEFDHARHNVEWRRQKEEFAAASRSAAAAACCGPSVAGVHRRAPGAASAERPPRHAAGEGGEAATGPQQGLTKFREQHFQLMIAYNQAAAPEFENASLTVLLDYHQCLMEKIMDVKWSPEILHDFLKADFRMRTKWILSWQRREFTTFKDVITHHRGQSAYLFSGAGDRKRPRSESQPRGHVRSRGQGAQTPRDEQPRKASKPGGAAGASQPPAFTKGNWPGLERTNKKTGQPRRPF